MKQIGELSDAKVLETLLPAGASLPARHHATLAPMAGELVRRLGRIPGKRVKSRLLSSLARRARRANQPEAYVALLDAVPSIWQDDPLQKFERLEALAQVGRGYTVQADLQSQALTDLALMPQILGMRRRQRLKTDTPFFVSQFGPVRRTFPGMLRHLPVERWMNGEVEATARALYALVQPADITEEAYVERFVWGFGARVLHSALSISVSDELRLLKRDMSRRIVAEFDPAPAMAAVAGGRSVMCLQAHAGISSAKQKYLRKLLPGVPQFAIGNRPEAETGGAGSAERRKLAVGNASPTEFLKLVKTVRQTPHGIGVLPDGQAGARKPASLLGREVQVGAGASVIAWHGRAEPYFLETKWREAGGIELVMTKGPVFDEFADRESYVAAFDAFYHERLHAIVTGPPENIAATRGGIWKQLLKPPAEAGAEGQREMAQPDEREAEPLGQDEAYAQYAQAG